MCVVYRFYSHGTSTNMYKYLHLSLSLSGEVGIGVEVEESLFSCRVIHYLHGT